MTRLSGRVRVAGLLVVALLAGLTGLAPAQAAAQFCDISLETMPNCYVEVSDGTSIAMSVRVPAHCFTNGSGCPTIFESAGYENGSAEDKTMTGEFAAPAAEQVYDAVGEAFDPIRDECEECREGLDQFENGLRSNGEVPLQEGSHQLSFMYDAEYATVHASVRGTGCSAGEFDLFSLRSAQDGAELIEWIADQEWSNDDVGIMGHSYSGITGFMVASQNPPSLRAVTVSGLIDDHYRGISYPGGVFNGLFPPLWVLGIRPAYDVLGGTVQGLARPVLRETGIGELNPYGFDSSPQQTAQCLANVATHRRTAVNDPVVQGGAGDTDNVWWQARALATFAHRIDVPIHIQGAYQDQETGPRGTARLWELIQGVPKRLILSNGNHGVGQSGYVMADRKRWMDHWMRGVDNGFGTLAADGSFVRVLQEFHGTPNSVIDDTRFPLTNTAWTPYYLRSDGSLSTAAPAAPEADLAYLSGSGRQSWFYEAGYDFGPPFTTADGGDELTFASAAVPAGQTLSIAGPVMATLQVASTAPDTELYVQLIDEAPDGTRFYLQRGVLKASHRAIDWLRSDCVNGSNVKVACAVDDPGLYRPHRPHTNPVSVTPGSTVEYKVEIWPVGHVFRSGHKIMVKVSAPPRVDSYYSWVQRVPPAINTLRNSVAASFVTLPVIPAAPAGSGSPVCGSDDDPATFEPTAVRCVSSPNG